MIAINNTLDRINMDWRKIDTLVTDAWNIVSRRPASYYSRLNLVDYVPDQAAGKTAVPFTNHAAITQATAPCTNKTLKCMRFNDDGSVCNDEFVYGLQRSRCSTSGSGIHPLQSHVQDTSSLHDNTPILNAAESLMGHHRNATTPTSRNANCFKRGSADSATNANLYMEVISSPSPTHPLHQKTMRIPSYGTCSFKKKNQVSRTQTMTLITLFINWMHLLLNGRGGFVQLPRLSGTVGKSYF